MMNQHVLEETADFLGGAFHQDIHSPEQALDEFIDETGKNGLEKTANTLFQFLDWTASEKEKAQFVITHTEIYFPAMNQAPLDWLQGAANKIRKAANKK